MCKVSTKFTWSRVDLTEGSLDYQEVTRKVFRDDREVCTPGFGYGSSCRGRRCVGVYVCLHVRDFGNGGFLEFQRQVEATTGVVSTNYRKGPVDVRTTENGGECDGQSNECGNEKGLVDTPIPPEVGDALDRDGGRRPSGAWGQEKPGTQDRYEVRK